jgi:DNA-binding transcriptional LysR family regulator
MPRRNRYVNLPIEIIRTVTAIVDCGSFTKAAQSLDLSQPAITAQMKRAQAVFGSPVFERRGGALVLNDRGKLLLPRLRHILAENDAIVSIGNVGQEDEWVRIGISELFLSRFLERYSRNIHGLVTITCEDTEELNTSIEQSALDMSCCLEASLGGEGEFKDWMEEFVWVKSPDFVLSAGEAIPLVTWPTRLVGQLAINALNTKNIAFRLSFLSWDLENRIKATLACIGITVCPKSQIPVGLVEAKDYYLPRLPAIRAGIRTRRGFDLRKHVALLELLAASQYAEGHKRILCQV